MRFSSVIKPHCSYKNTWRTATRTFPPALEGKAQIQKEIRECFFKEASESLASNTTTGQEQNLFPGWLSWARLTEIPRTFQQMQNQCKAKKLGTRIVWPLPWWVPYARWPTRRHSYIDAALNAKMAKKSSKFSQHSPVCQLIDLAS